LGHATPGWNLLDSHADLVTIPICVRDVSAAAPARARVIARDPCLPRSRKERGAPRLDEAHKYVFANQPYKMINGLLVQPGRVTSSSDTEQSTLARRERGVLYQQPPAFSEDGRGLGLSLTVLGIARERRLHLSEHASCDI